MENLSNVVSFDDGYEWRLPDQSKVTFVSIPWSSLWIQLLHNNMYTVGNTDKC